jgi:ankyrin repeat protein
VLDDDAVGVTHFFNDNSSCVNQRDEKGWMPIHIAAEQGYSNALHALLRCEADMEAFDDEKCAREKLGLPLTPKALDAT